MSMTYSIKVLNNSEQSGTFCLYQVSQNPQEASLAWLTERAIPHDNAGFTWNLDYSFVQGEVGTLSPGVIFRAQQVVPASLDQQNTITLTEQGSQSVFVDPRNGIPNMLTILTDRTVQPNRFAAGIGIDHSPILVAPVFPNMNLVFQPQTRYRLAFGNFTKGEVLNSRGIINYAEIDFMPGVFSYNVTFNPNGTWTVQPA